MDFNMKANLLTDYKVALAIINDPVISDCITEDCASIYIPDLVNETWVYIENKEKIIGCYRLESKGTIHGQIHAFVLPEHRSNSIESSQCALEWYFDNITMLKKITCQIPTKYKNVINHAMKSGFKHEGTIEQAFLKNNITYDIEILGIRRDK
jgi:RimJ/RimL family protein N-acetyltransferase